MKDLSYWLKASITFFSLLAILFIKQAHADEINEIFTLIRAGQLSEALTKVDATLAKQPRDAQMCFVKGIILSEQNKSTEAIAVFTKLTEDFPNLPEPYNNLAALYAESGQYEKARVILDKAIRTHPAYATIYENLGDIHAKLASQAYDKALQLDSHSVISKSKLTLVRSLETGMNSISVPKLATVTPQATGAGLTANSKSATLPPLAKAETITKELANDSLKEAVKAPSKSAVKETAKTAHLEREAVLLAVNAWAKAWSDQDLPAYFNYYSSTFETPGGVSRKTWTEDRQARIAGKEHIKVKIESPEAIVNGETATVKFRQIYVSDRLNVSSRKTLVLVKHNGKWLIQQERSGS